MDFASTDLSGRAHDTVRMAVLGGVVRGKRDAPHFMAQLEDHRRSHPLPKNSK
jgi:hypothetical protein